MSSPFPMKYAQGLKLENGQKIKANNKFEVSMRDDMSEDEI